ncbi:class I SAM-dependent methyltransferase [Neptuniibacter caesariensis]|uniref:Methyltransferase type 11 domain-containing protein n=1 Tax=Neptuniibacter caesariensis TaxID=207954 RepID=A0A7U8GRK8_NEPCE|nr:methyltransferase domain-containing protein [Neptuniibacter caesariensis]EAR60250.1 hypothetical protein MED92_02254 [Oceanospirillum sp. MED92] [Neptuniibacter caesariensis]
MDNFPAVSAEWAMSECPEARDAERSKLLELAQLRPGIRVLDLQAAGGYLSDGIYEHLHGDVEIICLEPCKQLNSRLSDNYLLVEDPVERWASVPDCSVDLVVGLAGLHHSNDQQATVDEAFRVLKPGGQVVICDVIEDTGMARWLNEFVNENNPKGHEGAFLNEGQLTSLFEKSGFKGCDETVESVPWVFDSPESSARFFKGLFGLNSSENGVLEAMGRYLKLEFSEAQCQVEWYLIYGRATK